MAFTTSRDEETDVHSITTQQLYFVLSLSSFSYVLVGYISRQSAANQEAKASYNFVESTESRHRNPYPSSPVVFLLLFHTHRGLLELPSHANTNIKSCRVTLTIISRDKT